MISLGLNVLLGMLLICGLMLGLRLDQRLRGLRDSHSGFAKAVEELDQAAARTEASLATLRAGTELARTELVARIDQARLLTQRLDKLNADAERLMDQPLPLTRPLSPPAAPAAARPAPRPAADPIVLRSAPEPRPGWRPEPRAERRPDIAAAGNARSRVIVDDDLFEGGDRRASLAAVAGGRR